MVQLMSNSYQEWEQETRKKLAVGLAQIERGELTLCALKRRRFYREFQSISLSYPSFRHCLNIGFLP